MMGTLTATKITDKLDKAREADGSEKFSVINGIPESSDKKLNPAIHVLTAFTKTEFTRYLCLV